MKLNMKLNMNMKLIALLTALAMPLLAQGATPSPSPLNLAQGQNIAWNGNDSISFAIANNGGISFEYDPSVTTPQAAMGLQVGSGAVMEVTMLSGIPKQTWGLTATGVFTTDPTLINWGVSTENNVWKVYELGKSSTVSNPTDPNIAMIGENDLINITVLPYVGGYVAFYMKNGEVGATHLSLPLPGNILPSLSPLLVPDQSGSGSGSGFKNARILSPTDYNFIAANWLPISGVTADPNNGGLQELVPGTITPVISPYSVTAFEGAVACTLGSQINNQFFGLAPTGNYAPIDPAIASFSIGASSSGTLSGWDGITNFDTHVPLHPYDMPFINMNGGHFEVWLGGVRWYTSATTTTSNTLFLAAWPGDGGFANCRITPFKNLGGRIVANDVRPQIP